MTEVLYRVVKFLNARPELIFTVVFFTLFAGYVGVKQIKYKRDLRAKDQILQEFKDVVKGRDRVIKEKDGIYSKLVSEYSSSKELLDSLEQENYELAKLVGQEKEVEIKTYMKLVLVPVSITNSVAVTREVASDSTESISFTTRYPSEGKEFARVNGKITGDSLASEWKFTPIQTDLVISEVSSGVFKATAGVPKWMSINELEVNSIPQPKVGDVHRSNNNYGITVGASIGRDYDGAKNFGVNLGYRINKYSIFVNQSTDGSAKLLVNKLIKW